MEVVVSLSQGRTATAQCGLFTHKSVPVIFEPPCIIHVAIFNIYHNSSTEPLYLVHKVKWVFLHVIFTYL